MPIAVQIGVQRILALELTRAFQLLVAVLGIPAFTSIIGATHGVDISSICRR